MVKMLDNVMSSADYVEAVCGYRPVDDIISLESYQEIQRTHNADWANHWDYPLSEFPDLLYEKVNNGENEILVMVEFADEYRVCELGTNHSHLSKPDAQSSILTISKERFDELGMGCDSECEWPCKLRLTNPYLIAPCVDERRLQEEMTEEEYDAYRHNRLVVQ